MPRKRRRTRVPYCAGRLQAATLAGGEKARPPLSLLTGEADLPSGIRLACLSASPGTKLIDFYQKITFIAAWSITVFDRLGFLESAIFTRLNGHDREEYVTDSPNAPMAADAAPEGRSGGDSHVVRALKLLDSFDVAPVEKRLFILESQLKTILRELK